jgi:AGZA family xanthine/uracil permease-like MFS transporter
MVNRIATFFRLSEHGTNFRREFVGGVTTFLTMSYIVVVNPAILKSAGIPAGASMVATIVTAIFGTVVMGLYANRPFAIAPYMGENAFVAYTVVGLLGYHWQSALGAVFLGGLVFLMLTIFRLRQWLLESIPSTLSYSFAVGIGLFLTFIGLNEAGIVVPGTAGAPLHAGNLSSAPVLVAILGFVIIAALVIRRFPGAILAGMAITTIIAILLRVAKPPQHWVSPPPSLSPLLLQISMHDALTWSFFPVVLTIFVMAFVDTMGTLIGVSLRAGFLDKNGHLPQVERPMIADALATVFAALVGTTTSGAYIESASCVEAGGRTGLTALVTAACFAGTLFFAPVVAAIPAQAYAPALIIVGLLMLAPVTSLKFDDFTELIPAFAVIVLMSFTYNIGIGITAGFVLYALCKVIAGRAHEIRPGLWILSAISLLFFILYPYR